MTVQREDRNLSRITRSLDAGDIAVGIEGQLDGTCLMALDVIAQKTHFRIILASLRILIGVEARIGGILLTLGLRALEQLHAVLLHPTLVVAHPDNLLGVGRENH